ncbi:MAG: hypothetical protein KY463_06890, partial [Actinobacteria bacterium]|nr:hypothetical protein [Actinomycetota bacterium]
IAMHGNNKSTAELVAAVEAGVGRVVLDSLHEIARLDAIARERGIVAPVMIRATVGVEAHTHEFIATAHEDQKFGFSLAGGDAAEAVRRVLGSAGLKLVGLHSHIGSQIFDANAFELSAHRVIALLAQLRDEHGADALAEGLAVEDGRRHEARSLEERAIPRLGDGVRRRRADHRRVHRCEGYYLVENRRCDRVAARLAPSSSPHYRTCELLQCGPREHRQSITDRRTDRKGP